MEALKRAAERMLQALGDQPEGSAPAAETGIERLSIDVRIGEQTEVVVLRLRGSQLQTSCTCGTPRCAHAQLALRWLVSPQSVPLASDVTRRSSSRLERVVIERAPSKTESSGGIALDLRAGGDRFSLPLDVRPVPPPETRKSDVDSAALAEALDDAVTALVRAGVAAERSASVNEALSRVATTAGTPLPLGVARWIGRVHEAIGQRDVALAAHALRAASAVSADLRAATPDRAARERLASWLGDTQPFGIERLSDRLLLEVAREWLHGAERLQIERRYLVDLNSGEVFREERARRAAVLSVGSCPRLIGVGFAEVEQGCAPRRMHLLQYTTTPSIDRASWDLFAAWAQRDSEALAAAYRSALAEHGALSEPFALVLPKQLESTPVPALILDRGPPLPLGVDDDSGLLARFMAVCQAEESTGRAPRIAWAAGRLFDREGLVMLKPLAVGISSDAGLRHERL